MKNKALFSACTLWLLFSSSFCLGFPCRVGQTGPTDTELFQAVKENKVAEVQQLLSQGASANAKEEDGTPILQEAAARGNNAIVQLLLAHGAEVNTKSEFDNTALLSAAESGHFAVIKTLVAHGADVNAGSTVSDFIGILGDTILMAAMKTQKPEIVQFLLDKGAKIDLPNHSGQTPLLLACLLGRLKMARLFVANGASLHVSDEHGTTPFLAACKNGWTDFARLLVTKGADFRETDKVLANGLMLASNEYTFVFVDKKKNVACQRWLLSLGLPIEARDKNGATALLYAAANLQPASVQLLLNAGANANAADAKGRTALMHICNYGQDDVIPDKRENEEVAFIVRFLLAKGADPTLKDKKGKTALMYAQGGVHREVVALLRQAGAKE